MSKCAICNYDDHGTGDTAHYCIPDSVLYKEKQMKKGDRIRCIKACGALAKGQTGVCEKPPNIDGGIGIFDGEIYGLGHSNWREYFEVGQESPIAGMDGSRSALEVQQGGTHYKDLKIQPIEYIHANNIPFAEGCAIKYLTRWRSKGGLQDLEKAKHFIELLIELERKNA
jgi:hypothetical protein